jgi:hypothetical protein
MAVALKRAVMDRVTVAVSSNVTMLEIPPAKTMIDPLNRAAEADVVAKQGSEFRLKARDSRRFCTLVRMKGAEGWVEFTVTSRAGGTAVKRVAVTLQ